MWCGVCLTESDTEQKREGEREGEKCTCVALFSLCNNIRTVCVVAAELLLVFIHQEANVFHAEVCRGPEDFRWSLCTQHYTAKVESK